MTAQETGCAVACWDRSTEERDAVTVLLVQEIGRDEVGLGQSTGRKRDVVAGVKAQETAYVEFD